MEVLELKKEFIGVGEVKGFIFTRIVKSKYAYIYKVHGDGGNIHFEVFERKISPICLNFESRKYSKTEFKERYPKSKDFGIWAFTVMSYESAMIEFNHIISRCELKLNK